MASMNLVGMYPACCPRPSHPADRRGQANQLLDAAGWARPERGPGQGRQAAGPDRAELPPAARLPDRRRRGAGTAAPSASPSRSARSPTSRTRSGRRPAGTRRSWATPPWRGPRRPDPPSSPTSARGARNSPGSPTPSSTPSPPSSAGPATPPRGTRSWAGSSRRSPTARASMGFLGMRKPQPVVAGPGRGKGFTTRLSPTSGSTPPPARPPPDACPGSSVRWSPASAQALPVLTVWCAAIGVWALTLLVPGDPALRVLACLRGVAGAAAGAGRGVRGSWLGLDRSLPLARFWELVHLGADLGDLGVSWRTGRPVRRRVRAAWHTRHAAPAVGGARAGDRRRGGPGHDRGGLLPTAVAGHRAGARVAALAMIATPGFLLAVLVLLYVDRPPLWGWAR